MSQLGKGKRRSKQEEKENMEFNVEPWEIFHDDSLF
jgi:hypothetical protein